jgi:porin
VKQLAGYTRSPRDGYEAAIETYRARVSDVMTIQPDMQYIVNPGADPALSNGLALGVRLEFSFAFAP